MPVTSSCKLASTSTDVLTFLSILRIGLRSFDRGDGIRGRFMWSLTSRRRWQGVARWLAPSSTGGTRTARAIPHSSPGHILSAAAIELGRTQDALNVSKSLLGMLAEPMAGGGLACSRPSMQLEFWWSTQLEGLALCPHASLLGHSRIHPFARLCSFCLFVEGIQT